MSVTQSISIAKPLSSLQLKCIPSERNMRSCGYCHTDHDPRLNPDAEEFFPRQPVELGSGSLLWSDGHRLATQSFPMQAFGCRVPMWPLDYPPPPPAGQRKYPWLYRSRGGQWGARPAHVNGGGPVTVTNSSTLNGKPAKADRQPASRCAVTGPRAEAAAGSAIHPHCSPPAGHCRETGEQTGQETAAPAQKTEQPPPLPSTSCDIPASDSNTRLFCKVNSVPNGDRPLPADMPDTIREICSISIHAASALANRVPSPVQCSDSTKLRRPSPTEPLPRDRACCPPPAATTVISRQPSSSASSDMDVPSEPSTPAATSPARWRSCRSSSSLSANSESSDDSSSESSDDDSTLGDEEWDASAATFLPSSSVDSGDDFILFADDADDEPSGAPEPAPPRTPVFGPTAADQVDSGLSAETDPSDSEPEDSSDDELSDDECEPCHSSPGGTCALHQRIAEANRQLVDWCAAPPRQPNREARVRFLSGDRLATVHAAPDYDRAIASDLLDQQRQRDRLRRWRQDVDRQVAPVLAAVLSAEHRQRVLRERPELLRDS
ncbi:hypothetical protein FJT64_002628 [Amphibalanus amphitrite]|uniref:Uncharacterized protein n=1 Tax=Amphibalanus amphitrite TaxID=1232801 RepID=A0A6A4WI79_AMPAM|nr:hypothetical protein FJT64_002628 [Amphibalanus amphitrite]